MNDDEYTIRMRYRKTDFRMFAFFECDIFRIKDMIRARIYREMRPQMTPHQVTEKIVEIVIESFYSVFHLFYQPPAVEHLTEKRFSDIRRFVSDPSSQFIDGLVQNATIKHFERSKVDVKNGVVF